MGELLHQRGAENLIPARDKQALIEYAETIVYELPTACADCPAAYVCAKALYEDGGFGFPRTPLDVRTMWIKRGGSSFSGPSGQAQMALKDIVCSANEVTSTGPSEDGTRCCLDPDTKIDIDELKY